MIGRTLAHYTIAEKIGEGGMGEVHRAHDSRLGRDVALKILPPAFADDAERMARFEREARILASLNHPAIAGIFDLEREGDLHFLAMELVEGEDLAARLCRGALSLEETTGILKQLVGALEEAHSQGVVHRDLKPANVMLTPRGQVKVLDFGLAKVRDDAAADADASSGLSTLASGLSVAGGILGTPAYMSPEQARGQSTDSRSDLWALGCIVWECLTGKRLFSGATASDSLAAVLQTEPDWTLLPSETPTHVKRLLRRLLAKDADERLHHAADARLELDDASAEADVALAEPATPGRSLAHVALAVLLSLVGFLLADRAGLFGDDAPAAPSANPLAGATVTRLTDLPGDELNAAISPDGRFVAFLSNRDGPFDALLGDIETGGFRNLTGGRVKFPPGKIAGDVRVLGFNGDGSRIWLGGGYEAPRLMSVLGGPSRRFLGDKVVTLSWSPDGRRITYHLASAGDPVYVADHDGTNATLILDSPEGNHQHNPTWGSDGLWIYLSRGRPATGESDLWRIRPDGSELTQLTRGLRHVGHPTPIDSGTVLFRAARSNGEESGLWAFDTESGSSRRVSFGLERYAAVAASADGRRIIATLEDRRSVLRRIPILDQPAGETDLEAVAVRPLRASAPRLHEDRLYFLSSRGSSDGLWRHGPTGSVEILPGRETPILEPPAISADGESIAVVVRRDSQPSILVLSADGARRHWLAEDFAVRGAVSWSPDGEWLAAGGTLSGETGLFLIPVDGGPPRRLVAEEALSPAWSPTGDLIVYAGPQVQANAALLAVRPTGEPVELPAIRLLWGGMRARFLPDGGGIVYMQGEQASQDFFLLDLASLSSRRLTRLEDPAIMRNFDVTPDGTAIVFDRLSRNSDLMLIELEGPARPR